MEEREYTLRWEIWQRVILLAFEGKNDIDTIHAAFYHGYYTYAIDNFMVLISNTAKGTNGF